MSKKRAEVYKSASKSTFQEATTTGKIDSCGEQMKQAISSQHVDFNACTQKHPLVMRSSKIHVNAKCNPIQLLCIRETERCKQHLEEFVQCRSADPIITFI